MIILKLHRLPETLCQVVKCKALQKTKTKKPINRRSRFPNIFCPSFKEFRQIITEKIKGSVISKMFEVQDLSSFRTWRHSNKKMGKYISIH